MTLNIVFFSIYDQPLGFSTFFIGSVDVVVFFLNYTTSQGQSSHSRIQMQTDKIKRLIINYFRTSGL